MTTEAFRCADAASDRHEPLYGTASHVTKWLMIEQPGSWGADALMQSRFPIGVARPLRERANLAGVRLILIRRGVRMSAVKRRCYLATTDAKGSSLFRLEMGAAEDALEIDLESFARTGSVAGAVEQVEPLIVVCTHGRHDACCSIRGNQVSRVACSLPEVDAWECSHIGGDRFAANVVCFPHGIYYGRVSPDEVGRLIDGYSRKRLALEHYRGRCCYPFAVQSAEYYAREARSLTGVDDLTLQAVRRDGDRLAATFLLSGGEHLRVHVRVHRSHDHHRLTCASEVARPIPRYELESVESVTD